MNKILTTILLLTSLNGFSQQPIFATGSSGQIYSVDLANCSLNYVGTGQQYGDIALTPDGRLWGIANGDLYLIDTTNASYTLAGNFGLNCVSLVGLDDSTLLVESGMSLYGVRNTNLSTYLIGYIGYQACGDLTWYDDDLYMTSSGRLIKIVLNGTNTAILSVDTLNSLSNAIPTCEGSATASFVGDYNSIIGFNGPNVIKICQIDGTYQMLCPSLLTFGTPGAACFRLPTQVPQPTSCTMTTGLENVVTNLFSIFPNPTTNELNIQSDNKHYFSFNIYNTLGQLMTTGALESNMSTISITNLPTGIYSIELSTDNITERKCFVVKK